jgi:hypothetical protein
VTVAFLSAAYDGRLIALDPQRLRRCDFSRRPLPSLPDRQGDGAAGNHLFQALQKPVTGGGAGAGDYRSDAGIGQEGPWGDCVKNSRGSF